MTLFSDTIQRGISSTLSPILQELDLKLVTLRSSQTELFFEIERLNAGEFIMSPYVCLLTRNFDY